jgi:hypothetical protein
MKLRKFLAVGLAAFALSGAITNTPAYAASASSYHDQVNSHYSWLLQLIWNWTSHIHDRFCGHGGSGGSGGPVAGGGGNPAQVPELDGSAAAISLLLLGGLIALRRETKRT